MMNTNRQIFFHAIAARRTILRREIWRNFDQLFTSVFSFVFEFLEKGTPTCVVNLFAKYAFRHTKNRKFFNANYIICFNQICRNFVLKIGALIFNLLVNLAKQNDRFTSLVTAFLAARYSALCNSQFCLSRFVVFEIIYLRSVRARLCPF